MRALLRITVFVVELSEKIRSAAIDDDKINPA
jgi:hypothetical protein